MRENRNSFLLADVGEVSRSTLRAEAVTIGCRRLWPGSEREGLGFNTNLLPTGSVFWGNQLTTLGLSFLINKTLTIVIGFQLIFEST